MVGAVIQNYNVLFKDPSIQLRQKDFVIVCILDDFTAMTNEFKEFATAKKFYDEDRLDGFMKEVRGNRKQLKTMDELFDKDAEVVPCNVLHLFQCCSWDFGLSNLNGRRINFMFGVK